MLWEWLKKWQKDPPPKKKQKKQKTKKTKKQKIHASYEPRNTTVLVFLERELLRVVHLNSCSVIPVPGVDEPESVVLLHQ